MLDRSRTGMRCRARRQITTVEGIVPPNSQGTIRYEMENLDRQLIIVAWDNGIETPAFPHEIEVLEEQADCGERKPNGRRRWRWRQGNRERKEQPSERRKPWPRQNRGIP